MEKRELKPGDLNSLQVLLLTFVKMGLTTPYELISRASLSVGATSPALKRLEQAGLLTQSTGPRNRSSYQLSKKGEKTLQTALEQGKQSFWHFGGLNAFDTAPRVALLLWVYVGKEYALKCIEYAREELTLSADRKLREAEEARIEMSRIELNLFREYSPSERASLLAASYRWIKSSSDASLLKLQSEAISGLSDLLSGLPEALPESASKTS